MDKPEIAIDANEDEVTSKQIVLVTKINNKQNSLNQCIFMFIFYFCYPAHTFYFRFYGF